MSNIYSLLKSAEEFCNISIIREAMFGKRQLINLLHRPELRFGILSPYRGSRSKRVNQDNLGELLRLVNQAGYRWEKMRGEYKEDDAPKPTKEDSILIYNVDPEFLFELGNKFDQDSVIYKEDDVIGIYNLKKNTVVVAADPQKEHISKDDYKIQKGKALVSKPRSDWSFEFKIRWGERMPWNGKNPITREDIKKYYGIKNDLVKNKEDVKLKKKKFAYLKKKYKIYCLEYVNLISKFAQDLNRKSLYVTAQTKIVHNLDKAVKYYEKKFKDKLIPGPAGTKGQIFFTKKDSGKVIKLTTDESEARNMFAIMELQKKALKFKGVIPIHDVFKLDIPGNIYCIEQEKGVNLSSKEALKAYINRILFVTGPKLHSEMMDPVLEDLKSEKSKKLKQLGLTGKEIRKKIDPTFFDIRPSNMVYIPSEKDVEGPFEHSGHPSEEDYLKEADRKMFGDLKMIDIGYGAGNKKAKIPTK